MASFLDVCRFTPTLGGTTDWTYSAAVPGYQGPSAANAVNGAVYRYRAESADLSQWEIGYGAYTAAGSIFARTTVLFNSLGTTAKVSFSTVPQVAIVALAEDLTVPPITPGGRLTLTASTPVTTTDVVGSANVYYAPVSNGGGLVPIYNGARIENYSFLANATDTVGLALTLGASWAANTNYDWFVSLSAGAVTFGTVAWASDTARGTGAGTTELQLFNGLWTNKNSITLRNGNASTITVPANQATYVGTFRTVAAGQAEDSMAKRFVWNAYNQVQRNLKNVAETTVSWAYTLTTVRQANANAANQIDMVVGLAGSLLDAKLTATGDTSAGGSFCAVGIGINSTTVDSSDERQAANFTNRDKIGASLKTYPAIGRQFYAWLEYAGVAAGTNTYYGGSTAYIQSGISATMLM